ncbi:MAG: hypothetical protein C0617_03615 [Desulfuromonas sp.]|uniref:nuclease-related domain-containing protein n=1 Tax=Desulfuromonas sp. TaxID=892 RepID=UPI000CC42E17|nr:MAG: hypothetical protein C0617_03615 [Desulfuromonas sp.]
MSGRPATPRQLCLPRCPGRRDYLDNVIIGPKGLFNVETKTVSKPRCEAKIVYDGEEVRILGARPDRNPIVQAKAQSNWLKGFLIEETARMVAVQSVVLYPGWFVQGPQKHANAAVWTLSPKVLNVFISKRSCQHLRCGHPALQVLPWPSHTKAILRPPS